MHLGGSLEYQFVDASSKEMMRDFARVASSPQLRPLRLRKT
jgi:hypothetical protein